MSAGRGMDKECGSYATEHYSAMKRAGAVPFAATWVQPEMRILSEVSRQRKQTTVWHPSQVKQDTDGPPYETETKSQAQRLDLRLPKGRGLEGVGGSGSLGVSGCKLLCVEIGKQGPTI